MEKEQIVKALELCANNGDCNDCPINPHVGNYGYCTSIAINCALSLIREQEKRIEEVKADTVRKMRERLEDRYEFECSSDEDNALYYVDLCEWVERIEKELLEENK